MAIDGTPTLLGGLTPQGVADLVEQVTQGAVVPVIEAVGNGGGNDEGGGGVVVIDSNGSGGGWWYPQSQPSVQYWPQQAQVTPDLAIAPEYPAQAQINPGPIASEYPPQPGTVPGNIVAGSQPPVQEEAQPTVVFLFNPTANGAAINYTLNNGESLTMQPGEQQVLNGSNLVVYDSGSSGTKRYTISDGGYKWVLNDSGWHLYKSRFEVTIDNSTYAGHFNCLVNGEEVTIEPGQSVEYAGNLPAQVVFDRGDGGEPAQRLLLTGAYVVGVDEEAQHLELFDAEKPPLAPQ